MKKIEEPKVRVMKLEAMDVIATSDNGHVYNDAISKGAKIGSF